MTKKPLELQATFDITEEGDQCIIEMSSNDGRPLTPQIILDAVADMLTAKFSMTPDEWDMPEDALDS